MRKLILLIILLVKLEGFSQDQSFKELTKRDNKVFIEIPNDASRAGERYFNTYLSEWGYWRIVSTKQEADFIITLNIIKKGMGSKRVYATLLTKDSKEFLKSKNYKAHTSAFNGYNAYWASSKKIVKKYFRKNFK
ncbi:MAG TPA: hypothetical protein VK835_07930 [Bacteroidia bacterium]|jgi:hypothetical protein|nr:hypothetical protein [Bacteroidia bacterium]